MENLDLGGSSHVDALESTKKVGKCNLRKSLAWDAAFFTNAGVLDPDELSSMIGGGSSSKMEVLPGIEEDIYRSTDSLSSLGSENLSLESLEVDLFQDIRASIQRSSKASTSENSTKAALGDTGIQAVSSSREDLASKNVAKSSADPKKQTSHLQTPGKLNIQSSKKPQDPDTRGTLMKPVAGTGVPTPSLQKSTKASGRPNSGPSAAVGRSSVRANQAQLENAPGPGKMAPAPKVPCFNDSNRTRPKTVPPSKSSSSSSSTATKKATPKLSSSSDSSTSNASANPNRRKIAARSVNPTASSSIPKTPSKVTIQKKRGNGLSVSLRSSKLSSSISPANSISEWSVTSSSSTSSVNQSSNTMGMVIGTGSPRKSRDNAALNIVRKSTDKGLDRPENKLFRPNNEKPNAASTQSGPPLKSETAKPSGLRMPSPKIGFFDGVKSVAHTPNGSSQSRSGIPAGAKVGPTLTIPPGVSSKTKSPKLQPTGLAKPVGNNKIDTHKSSAPLPSKRVSNASARVHSSPQNVKTPLNLSPLTHNDKDDDKFSKTDEAEVKELCETNGGEIEKTTVVDMDKKICANLVNYEIVPKDEVIYDCKWKMTSEETNDDAMLIFEKSSTTDLKSDVDFGKQISDNLVRSKIVPTVADIYDCKGKMSSEEKSKDVKSITENLSPADLRSEIKLDKKLSSYSVNVKIDPVDGEERKIDPEEKNNDVTSITENISAADVKNENLDVKVNANSIDMKIVPVDGNNYESELNMLADEKNNDVESGPEKISLADLKSNMNLEVNMSANSGNMEIIPVSGHIYVCEGNVASKDKSNDAISTNGNISLAYSESDMNLDAKMSVNSFGDIAENMVFKEKINDVKLNTENIGCNQVICKMNSDEKSSARLVNLIIGPLNGEICHCEGKMTSEDKNNDVRSITKEFNPNDSKSEINFYEKLSANLVNVNISPVDGQIYGCEGKLASEEKNNEVTSITEKISPDEVKNDMYFDAKMRVNSGVTEIVPVDGKIQDSEEKITTEEKNNVVKSSTEKISLDDLKSNIYLEVKMSAISRNVEIVPVDGDIYDCQEKIASKENNNDAISINEKINLDDLKSDMNLDVKRSADSLNAKMVSVDGDIERNVLCNEKVDEVKLKTKKICDSDEESSANLVNANVAPVDGVMHEREMVCLEKRDDGKYVLQPFINNCNSLHNSAQKESQVGGLRLDVRHGYSEHDLQKENASNLISSPRDFGQREELLSNLSKIDQKSENITSTRTPLNDKNSTCNGYDFSTELSAEVVENTTQLPSLEYPRAEN